MEAQIRALYPGWDCRPAAEGVWELSRQEPFGPARRCRLQVLEEPDRGRAQALAEKLHLLDRVRLDGCVLGCEDWRIQETDRGWLFFLRYPDLDTVEKARRKRLERQEAVRLSTDPDQARERILAYLAQNALTETALRRLGADLCRGLAGLRESGVAQYNLTMEDLLTRPGGGFCLGGCGLLDPAQDTGLLAPEVALGEEPGDTAQVYALGMVLYRLLNDGRGPFLPGPLEPVTAEAEAEARRRRLAGEALPLPRLGGEKLGTIVLRACAYDPADRYLSPEALAIALEGRREEEKPVSLKITPEKEEKPEKPLSLKFKRRQEEEPVKGTSLKIEPSREEPTSGNVWADILNSWTEEAKAKAEADSRVKVGLEVDSVIKAAAEPAKDMSETARLRLFFRHKD